MINDPDKNVRVWFCRVFAVFEWFSKKFDLGIDNPRYK